MDVLQAVIMEKGFEEIRYPFSVDFEMPAQWLEPAELEAGQLYPLWIYLHGAGQRGQDGWRQLELGACDLLTHPEQQANQPCFVFAPQCPKDHRWVEVDWTQDSHVLPETPSRQMQALMEWIDELKETHPIDPDRVYVTGVSMGGFGTWDLLMRRPADFAAAVIICGGADVNEAERLLHLPIRMYHGAEDTVVKTLRSRVMHSAFQAMGAEKIYVEYPGVKHNSWVNAFSDVNLRSWLFAQSRTKI